MKTAVLRHHPTTAIALAIVSVLALACGGDDDGPTEPRGNGDTDPVPAGIEAVSDTLPSGTVGEPLADGPTVVVLDAAGDAVAGVTVAWNATAGSLSAANVETGSDGRASPEWTLGETAGEQTATASVDGVGSVEFTATATAGPAVSVAFGSESYSLEVGDSAELVVSLADAFGNVVDQDAAELTWSTTDSTVVTVDGDGIVTAGTEPGSADVIAALADLVGEEDAPDGSADTVGVAVGTGPAVAFELVGPAEVRAGDSHTLTIRAVDAYGNTAAGYPGDERVVFRGASPAPDGTHPTVAGTPFTSLTSLDFTAGEASAPMVLYRASRDTITVTDGEIEAAGEHRLVIDVSPGAAAAIALGRTFLTMTMLGQTETLDATVFDEYDNDSGEAVDWSSSRVQVAPVASDGTVEAFRTGYAEVTAAIDALAETVPVRVQPLTITAGQLHTCAIELDGSAVCWGDDGSGKLGDGRPIEPQDAPSDVAGGHTWSQLGAGNLHSCGVTTDGDAYCWGYDGSDQLGNGSPASNTLEPSLVEDPADGPVTWLQVSGGYDHTCGLTRDGEAYCWGSDASEQLGNGATSGNQATPSPVADPASGPVTWTQVSAGGFHACGVTTDAEMYCWGSDASGQLGNGDGLTGDQATPTLVADPGSGSVSWARVDAGSFHTCGLTTDGEAYCWGRDASGELGNGDALTGDQTAPTLVADPLDGPVTWLHVGAYRYHTCGVSAAGVAYCWGGDASGQIGDGDETTGGTAVPSRTADPADGPVAFVHAVPGESHSCGVTSAGEAYCWGSDEYGQLGNGDMITGDQDEPSQVESANAFAALAPAPFARFALARRVTAASGGGDLR